MPDNSDISILVVDDEPDLLEMIVRNLQVHKFHVLHAGSAAEALENIRGNRVDFVISDIRMPEKDGVALLEEIRRTNPALPVVILMTGFSDYSEGELLDRGALQVLSKPFNMKELVQLIRDNTGPKANSA